MLLSRDAEQLRINLTRLLVGEQVVETVSDEEVLPQRHRPVFVDDNLGVTSHSDKPLGELFGVRDRCRQRNHPNRVGQMDDDLFPNRTAKPVGEVMHLVHHHIAEAAQRRRLRVNHVPQHLGGHHDDGRVAVDRVVSGEQPDRDLPVPGDEIVVLLIRQRLDRRRVEALLPDGQREVHRKLADNRLAGTGRCSDQNAVTVFERLTCLDLEWIEDEPVPGGEAVELARAHGPASTRSAPGTHSQSTGNVANRSPSA